MSLDTAIAALATRLGTTTAPGSYRAIRLATADLPNQMPPLPAVLVFQDGGAYRTGNGTRIGHHDVIARFYYGQTGDLPRDSVALRAWHEALAVRLQGAAQLGGLVDRATIDGYKFGVMSYAGNDYTGIEYRLTLVMSEAWSAVA